MGRPREHSERTAEALLAAAERMVSAGGADSLSVRGVAKEVGTTTRAVYSLFGSKDGLVAAISVRGFDVLREGVERQPSTSSPEKDLVDVGLVFRHFVVEHPSIFRMAFQGGQMATSAEVRAAALAALRVLQGRIARLDEAGMLSGFGVDEATLLFHAMCEGLADLELSGTFASDEVAEQYWTRGIRTVVRGITAPS